MQTDLSKKQVSHIKYINRLLTTMLDLYVIIFITMPVSRLLYIITSFNHAWVLSLVQMIALCFYFIFFWSKFGTTPAKYLFGIKICDAETLEKPSLKACIKRMLALITYPIGIWFIIFSKNHQALHDKIAKTIVIKR
jgi:uncharacterized RDD family membrane protein YckC